MSSKIIRIEVEKQNNDKFDTIEELLDYLESSNSDNKIVIRELKWIIENLERVIPLIISAKITDSTQIIKNFCKTLETLRGNIDEIAEFINDGIILWFAFIRKNMEKKSIDLIDKILDKWNNEKIQIVTIIVEKMISSDEKILYNYKQVKLHSKWHSQYYFENFLHDYRETQIYQEGDEKIEDMIEKMRDVIRIVDKGTERYIILKTRLGITYTSLEKFKSRYSKQNGNEYILLEKTEKKGVRERKSRWIFEEIFNNVDFQIFDIDWVPYSPLEEDPLLLMSMKGPSFKKLNIFNGFQAKLVDEIDMTLINPWLKHLQNVWFQDDEELEEWIISWFAMSLQKPRERLPMISIVGKQGAGKTLPIDFFMNFVLGFDENCVLLGDLGDLVTRFNSLSHHKFLIYIAELEGTENGSSSYRIMNKLKPFITESKLRAEKKGVDPISMSNFTHLISTSNNRHCLQLEEEDRRHCVIEASNEKIGDRKYFDNLWNKISQQKVGNHLFTYLLNYNITIDLKKIPLTSLRKEIIADSRSSVVKFLECLDKGDFFEKTKCFHEYNSETYKILRKKLYLLFCNWADITGSKRFSNSIFGKELKENGIESLQIKNFGRVYFIPKNNVSSLWIDKE